MTTKIKISKMLPFSDVPEVQGFVGKFVYNFFVQDELYNANGSSRFQGGTEVVTKNGQKLIVDKLNQQVDPTVLNSEMSRFNELDWTPSVLRNNSNIVMANDTGIGQPGFLLSHKDRINSEGSMNSSMDAAITYSDLPLRSRLVDKLNFMSRMLSTPEEPEPVSSEDILKKLEGLDNVDDSISSKLLSKLAFADSGFVNERRIVDRTTQFLDASEFKMQSAVDRRAGSMIFNPIFSQNIRMIPQFHQLHNDNKKNSVLLRNESQKSNFELGVTVLPGKLKLPDNSKHSYQVTTAGYEIERTEPGPEGLFSSDKRRYYYVDGVDTTKFIDTQVIYNQTYRYKISAVYAMQFTVATPDNPTTSKNEAGWYRCVALVKSKESNSVILKTTELVPPAEPDGVLYRYNYDAGTGLLINWQMPVGKQRDIKYFQVLRRRNIFEPFTCIAQLDFNDTILEHNGVKIKPIEKPEKVREDRVYKLEYSRTFFNDARFDRRSKYIYAVAAVDAHGLTSGYSAQTEVGFDRNKNRLTLETISRPGAPKQYPNFFIDPKLDDNFTVDSLTTDVMLSSKKQQLKIYFDPDAVRVDVDGNEDSTSKKYQEKVRIIRTSNKHAAEYVLNILNVDRQISKNFKIKIQDNRKWHNEKQEK